jgi:outer membrane protein assembly factor BamB
MKISQTHLSRRPFFLLLAGAPLFGQALGRSRVAAQSPDDATVALMRGDAGQTGQMAGPAPAGEPVHRWSVPGFDGFLYAPVVAGSTVLAVAERPDTAIVALDLETGEERWRFERGGRNLHTTAISAGDGQAYFSAHGGEEGDQPWLSPVAGDGAVYVAASTGLAVALDVATGQELWRADIGFARPEPPALSDGLLAFLGGEGVIVLNAGTGDIAWSRTILASNVALSDGVLYLNSSGTLRALEAATGDDRWHFSGNNGVGANAPAIAGGMVYVGGVSSFYALEAATGEIQWQVDDLPIAGTAALVDGGLFLPTGIFINAYERHTGDELWSTDNWAVDDELERGATTPLTIIDGQILTYYRDDNSETGIVALGDPA